ncbi:phosphatidic acid phosphatase type 2/haloperoxidase [Amylocystis lapponica]|nr:phosphatidic acid phosphatase type 2/haloperoxidase [Amylocystis lapponica]
MIRPSLVFPGYAHEVPRTDGRRVRELIVSYAPDCGASLALDLIPGFKREFSLTDTTYALHERVPPIALYFICGAAPFVLQLVINLFTVRSWWDAHAGTLGLILSLTLTGAITQVTKVTVGRPRPDLIARCMPRADVTIPSFGLATAAICTQTDKSIMEDGWRSFPSGHSSCMYLPHVFLCPLTRRTLLKAWLTLVPLAAAALVAISRTMDYRHHATDVMTGSLLGFVVAYFSYRQYYPSLAAELSHRPYSPRIKREELLPMHRRSPSGLNAQGRYIDVRLSEDDHELRPEIQPGSQQEHLAVWKDDISRNAASSQDVYTNELG